MRCAARAYDLDRDRPAFESEELECRVRRPPVAERDTSAARRVVDADRRIGPARRPEGPSESERASARARPTTPSARARHISAGRFGMRARQTHVLKASIESEPGGFFVATPSPLDEQRARAPSVTQITVVTEIATRRMAPRDQSKRAIFWCECRKSGGRPRTRRILKI